MSVTNFKICTRSKSLTRHAWPAIRNLARRDASLIMQSHALSLLIGKCMAIIVQSIPEKNPVVEFHGARSKFVSCDKRFKLNRVLELREL